MRQQPSPRKDAAAPESRDASQLVRSEWLNRVEAEYRSASIVQHLTLWLMQAGASPDLLHDGLRIAGDEITHADLSFEVFVAAGGTGAPAIVRETLGLRRHEPDLLEVDITRICVDTFCLGETVAVPLFKELREGCIAPSARRALDRILRDEVRHRDFGWSLLDWLLESPHVDAVRALISRELPSYFARLRGVYGGERLAASTVIDPSDRAWGLMAPAQYPQVLARALERDWIPRFAKRGIDAPAAWATGANSR